MHNQEYVLENETHKILFQTAMRPDLVTVNKMKRTGRMLDFAVPDDHWVKLKESKKETST